MTESDRGLVAFLGASADRRLLGEDLGNLPEAEQHHETVAVSHAHNRLVAGGSLLTGASLIVGGAMLLYGGGDVLFGGGGTVAGVLAVVGILLVATHWGWVHVAEYAGLVVDDRHRRMAEIEERDWLATVRPYPRFSVSTTVLNDASTRIQRFRHEPVLVTPRTFTFVRHADIEQTYDVDAPAEVIAAAAETMRHRAQLETDRFRGDWEAASSAYEAAVLDANDDQQRLIAQRAAAAALSEHINASLLKPPLVE